MTDEKSDKINMPIQDKKNDQKISESDSAIKDGVKCSAVEENLDVAEITSGENATEDTCSDLAEALQLAEDNRDKWMRAVAEFENYKKRSIQERSKLLKYRNEELLRDLLPVIDNLERAIAASANEKSGPLLDGVRMTANIFKEVLGRFGVNPIESLGKIFNPQFQEAIATLKDPSKEPNSIIEELEKGYMYQDKLLRPAKVVVATK